MNPKNQLRKKVLQEEIDHKSLLKTNSNTLNDSDLNENFNDSILDSISEGTENTLIQKIPVLSCAPARHSDKSNEINKALWKAAQQGKTEACKGFLTMVSHGEKIADVNYRGPNDWTPLHIAAESLHLSVCEVLLDYCEDTHVNCRTDQLSTPLHIVCTRGNLQIAQFLIRSGADINAIDINGETPLHIAAKHGHQALVNWLLSRGPNLYIKNKYGYSPEDVASSEIVHCFHRFLKRTISTPIAGPSIKESVRAQAKKIVIKEISEAKQTVIPQEFVAINVLGRGSFGEVFLVEKQGTGQLYAMKCLKKEKIMGQSLIRYAITERNVLSYIKHPFIVSLKFAFQTTENLFLIIDYCPGGDLGSYLYREKFFTEQRAKIYLCEILLALEELHKQDIIYRDLKPDNIVLDSDGHVMLTDFGLSKEGINDMTQSFCGSLAYLAPEMIRRQGHGKAVDWYLFGVLFYEMVTGFPPYFSKNRTELLDNIQRGKLKMSSKLSVEAKELIRDVSSYLVNAKRPDETIRFPQRCRRGQISCFLQRN